MEEQKERAEWSIEIGLYPGILFGVRTYEMLNTTITVFYLPLVDITFVKHKLDE